MMATLLKHEWLRTQRMIAFVLGVAGLVIALATVLTVTGWPLLATLGTLIGVMTLGLLIPGLQLALAVHYWRSSYSRTGYFTQSLPIRGSKIFSAKLVWALLVSIIGAAVTAVLALIYWPAFAGRTGNEQNPFTVLGHVWSELTAAASPAMIIAGTLTFALLILAWPTFYFFAASIGSETPLNRLGASGPVIVFIATYLVMQLAMFAALLTIPWGIDMGGNQLSLVSFNLLEEMRAGSSTNDVMPIGFIPALLLLSVVFTWRTGRSWNKKVSLV